MVPMLTPSGRPEPGEYAAYAEPDLAAVQGDDIVRALGAQLAAALAFLGPLGPVSDRAYAPGKWTVKQVLGHLADDERIFQYRTLCLARGDAGPLPGFDENLYVATAGFERRSWEALLDDFAETRRVTLRLFATFEPEAWLRRGVANGYEASARGLAFQVAGHELHHLQVLRERYL